MINFNLKISSFEKWNISYDEFTDELRLFEPQVFNLKKNNLREIKKGDFRVAFDFLDQVMIIEIKNVYDKTKLSINKADKNSIINFAVESIKKNLDI